MTIFIYSCKIYVSRFCRVHNTLKTSRQRNQTKYIMMTWKFVLTCSCFPLVWREQSSLVAVFYETQKKMRKTEFDVCKMPYLVREWDSDKPAADRAELNDGKKDEDERRRLENVECVVRMLLNEFNTHFFGSASLSLSLSLSSLRFNGKNVCSRLYFHVLARQDSARSQTIKITSTSSSSSSSHTWNMAYGIMWHVYWEMVLYIICAMHGRKSAHARYVHITKLVFACQFPRAALSKAQLNTNNMRTRVCIHHATYNTHTDTNTHKRKHTHVHPDGKQPS